MNELLNVSVVVPALDRPDDLHTCLSHLVDQSYEQFEVLVADSGTGENDSVVNAYIDDLDLLQLKIGKNGLPRARNTAIAEISERTDIVAFCDEDACPVPEWLSTLVAEYEADENVGAVGGPVVEPGESLTERSDVGRVFPNGDVTGQFDADHRARVQHLRGTNMSFRVDVFEELGGFDPAYRGTAHFEDTDATYRVYDAGFDVIYAPEAKVEHHHPMDERDLERYYRDRLRNWKIFFEKTRYDLGDKIEFYGRLTARRLYYSATVRKLLV